MPIMLWRIISFLGPTLIKIGFEALIKKYPDLFPVIKDIMKWIDDQPNKEEAVKEVKKVLYSTAQLPEPKGLA